MSSIPKSNFSNSIMLLGLDPGSRVTGYGVIEAANPVKPRYIECGVLKASEKLSLEDRVFEIAGGVREVIEEFRPQSVAMEDLFVQRNVRSALKLGQIRGALLFVVAEAALRVYSYSPATVKKTVTGRGRASKAQIQQMVKTLMGLKQTPALDASDALAVALCHARHAKRFVKGSPKETLEFK